MIRRTSLGICRIILLVCLASLWACTDTKPSLTADNSIQQASVYVSPDSLLANRVLNNLTAFETTLHPILVEKCGACHGIGGGISPQFASSVVDVSLTEIFQNDLVSFVSPHTSALATKVSTMAHNCWDNCSNDALFIIRSIIDWRLLFNNSGQGVYEKLCLACHGDKGQGVNDVAAFTVPILKPDLVATIESGMPPENPSLCTGVCAADVADYILSGLAIEPTLSEEINPLITFKKGQEQITKLCEQLAVINRQDIVRTVFCGIDLPVIESLGDLQTLLGLGFTPPPTDGTGANISNPSFVLTGHSTSLVARSTSAINPRAIIFNDMDFIFPTKNIVAIGFNRGEQFVEIVTLDKPNGELFFYLFTFDQSCNLNNQCTNTDLLTRKIELNWTAFTLYSQTDLKNTIFDCLQCHQPDGPGTAALLRMQEINFPWTHFLTRFTEGGSSLFDDYFAAHTENDSYANIPPSILQNTDPFLLELFIGVNSENGGGFVEPPPFISPPPPIPTTPVLPTNPSSPITLVTPPPPPIMPLPPSPSPVFGFASQPNQFDSFLIEEQVKNSNPQQPNINLPAGVSPQWQTIYDASVRGEFIPVPYHDIKVTDPDKLALMSSAYRNFITNNTLPNVDLPDIRDVFLDSQLRDMGFKVQANLDGVGIITQACAQCHNSKLDQTISRAKFNVDLSMMSDLIGGQLIGDDRDAEIRNAITRLLLNHNDVKKMPPERFKTLDQFEIDLATEYFCTQITGVIYACN